jgi:hypothetical protein
MMATRCCNGLFEREGLVSVGSARARDGSDDPQWQIRLSDGRRPRHPHGVDGQGVTS